VPATSGSEQTLIIEATGLATYPDTAVYCDGMRRHAEDDHALCDPTVIAEVVSPGTESWDRGEKFRHYRLLPSLTSYLLLSSTRPRIELCTVTGPESWTVRVYGPGEKVSLPELGIELSVDAIYEDALTSCRRSRGCCGREGAGPGAPFVGLGRGAQHQPPSMLPSWAGPSSTAAAACWGCGPRPCRCPSRRRALRPSTCAAPPSGPWPPSCRPTA